MIIVLGIICIIMGLIFKAFPPKKINSLFGYRTMLSMKNQDTWKESHKYVSNTLIILGISFIPLQFILSQWKVSYNYEKIILLVCFVIMIIVNEVHLRKVFNMDGSRKVQYR